MTGSLSHSPNNQKTKASPSSSWRFKQQPLLITIIDQYPGEATFIVRSTVPYNWAYLHEGQEKAIKGWVVCNRTSLHRENKDQGVETWQQLCSWHIIFVITGIFVNVMLCSMVFFQWRWLCCVCFVCLHLPHTIYHNLNPYTYSLSTLCYWTKYIM